MSNKFQNKYRIPSVRATFHDYNGGAYFITICTAGMEHFFGEISGGEIKYSKIGLCAVENIENITSHYPYAEIPLYTVMPNHIHLIIFIDPVDRRDAIHRVSDDKSQSNTIHRISNDENKNKTDIPNSEKLQASSLNLDTINQDTINRDAINRVSTGGVTGMKNPMLHDNLARVIRWYKGSVSFQARKINPNFAWQTRYHDRIIRDRHEMNRIAEYIENNVINWELDDYYNPS